MRQGGVVDPAAGGGEFLFAGVAAEAEADRGAGLDIGEADSAEHMAGAAGTAGTGRAQREGEISKLGDQAGAIFFIFSAISSGLSCRSPGVAIDQL